MDEDKTVQAAVQDGVIRQSTELCCPVRRKITYFLKAVLLKDNGLALGKSDVAARKADLTRLQLGHSKINPCITFKALKAKR